jgi:hypothetical protein
MDARRIHDPPQEIGAQYLHIPARIVDGVASVAIDVHELAMLLEGIEVAQVKTKPRWEPPVRVRSTVA